MRRGVVVLAILAGAAMFGAPSPAWADEPVVGAVSAQRVEILPSGPLCWRLNVNNTPPGVRQPPQGFLGGPPRFSFMFGGDFQRIEYATGVTAIQRGGEAYFIGQDNWFARTTQGSSTVQTAVLQLICGPGAAIVATSGQLPGVNPQRPNVLYFGESTFRPGDATATLTYSGPTVEYVMEGSVMHRTGSWTRPYAAGQMTEVVPAGVPSSITAGSSGARVITLQIHPADQSRVVAAGPAAPRALPNTGDDLGPWASFAALAGLVLLAGGRLQRRYR